MSRVARSARRPPQNVVKTPEKRAPLTDSNTNSAIYIGDKNRVGIINSNPLSHTAQSKDLEKFFKDIRFSNRNIETAKTNLKTSGKTGSRYPLGMIMQPDAFLTACHPNEQRSECMKAKLQGKLVLLTTIVGAGIGGVKAGPPGALIGGLAGAGIGSYTAVPEARHKINNIALNHPTLTRLASPGLGELFLFFAHRQETGSWLPRPNDPGYPF